jgi:hypothetical protein
MELSQEWRAGPSITRGPSAWVPEKLKPTPHPAEAAARIA